jgi:hypothetical protein
MQTENQSFWLLVGAKDEQRHIHKLGSLLDYRKRNPVDRTPGSIMPGIFSSFCHLKWTHGALQQGVGGLSFTLVDGSLILTATRGHVEIS